MNNSEESNSEKLKKELDDPKTKFLEALEKKNQGIGIRKNNTTGSPKVSGSQATGNTLKIFRRKSGNP